MDIPNRQSIRLKNYDYSSGGAYFVTICTQNREILFGDIIDGNMILNNIGKIVKLVCKSLPNQYQIELGSFQIMPNHIHMTIIIVGAGSSRPIPLGNIIAYFKYQSTILNINQQNKLTYTLKGRRTRPLQIKNIKKYSNVIIMNTSLGIIRNLI